MSQKLDDFSSSLLISSIEDSLREFWGNWGRAPQSELYDGPDMMRLYTSVPYAFCNGVVCSQFSPANIDAAIEETIAYFSGRNAKWEWIVGPNSIPASLDKSLEKHGLRLGGEPIGMAISLDAMNPDVPPATQVRISPVADGETLKCWANTMIEGFGSPALYPTFVDLERSLGCDQNLYRRYLGILDEKPVSTCALFLGEKVAGVYCVSTVPHARGLGIGAAITQYALREALAMGYHVAVLQSTPMGRNVYRRLGFQELSTLKCYKPAN